MLFFLFLEFLVCISGRKPVGILMDLFKSPDVHPIALLAEKLDLGKVSLVFGLIAR